MKKVLLVSLVFIIGFILVACNNDDGGISQEQYDLLRSELDELRSAEEEDESDNVPEIEETESDIETSDEEPNIEISDDGENLTFGSTFDHRGFEIEIGSADDIRWLIVENSFNDYYGNDVIGIPVTVTNHSGETGTLNSFSYNFFGSNGTRLSNVVGHRDYDIWSQGDMRDGASQEGYFLLMYDGDGDYFIEFSSPDLEVVLPISK